MFAIITHPHSGEAFAVEFDDQQRIVRAAGPAVWSGYGIACDPLSGAVLTTEGIRDWLDNADQTDAHIDGAWLQETFEHTADSRARYLSAR